MLFLLTAAVSLWAEDKKEWMVICSDGQAMPVSEVACLVAADDEDLLNIVKTDGTTVAGVSYITFEYRNVTGITLPQGEKAIEASRSLNFSMLPAGTVVEIYTTDGRLVRKADATTLSIDNLKKGSYLIKINNVTTKLLKK